MELPAAFALLTALLCPTLRLSRRMDLGSGAGRLRRAAGAGIPGSTARMFAAGYRGAIGRHAVPPAGDVARICGRADHGLGTPGPQSPSCALLPEPGRGGAYP